MSVYSKQRIENRNLTFRDMRLLTMRHTDTRFEMPSYASREAWERRAQKLRRHILTTTGLWPIPEKTSLNARVFGRIEGEDYTIEKVYFESYPNFFVAGNIYRPKGKEGPHPGILSPHGHWKYGRTHNSKRGSIPARGINLARQGHVVFTYDMVGFGDTRQVDHTFAADSLSQLWGISLMGLQLWNSIRTLDFVRSLPDVDPQRVGITGASGGATQTFMLTAVDRKEALAVTAPVNMISAQMQGGDLCENVPGLRLNTFNVEIGALAAPRPQLMVSNTHDWTVNTPFEEYPMMRSIYRLYGTDDKLDYAHLDFQHNYNKASREAVYPWLGRRLLKEEPASYAEKPINIDEEDLLVFLKERIGDRTLSFEEIDPTKYKAPPKKMNASRLKAYMRDQAREQLRERWPSDAESLDAFRKTYGAAYRHVLAARKPNETQRHMMGTVKKDGFTAVKQVLARSGQKDWIPSVWLKPEEANKTATIVVAPSGKQILFQDGKPVEWIRGLLAEGQSVFSIDPFKIGEHALPKGTETRRDESFEFFTTFNRTDAQQRVQDILTALSFLKSQPGIERVNLVGIREASTWVLLASPLAGDAVDQVVAYRMGANPEATSEALQDYFVPGLFRIGGLSTAAALTAPGSLTLDLEDDKMGTDAIARIYNLIGMSQQFEVIRGQRSLGDIVHWLQD
jgi:dienelactone hydrolase